MGGIYDILESYRQQNDPRFIYDGLYQDPLYNIATANPLKAMSPGYEYRNSDAINRYLKSGAYDMSGNVPADYDRAIDFKRYFEDRPLKTLDYGNRFQDFKPRVGFPNTSVFGITPENFSTTGIMQQAPDIVRQAPTQNFEFLSSAYEDDDAEQVDSLTGEKKGLAKIFDFLQQFSPMQMIGKGIGAFFNPKESDRYRPATAGIYGYSPRELNQMNALGGYYSEPARAQRRLENRLANLIKRRDEGKSYSQKNLDSITQSLSGAASQAQFATKKAAAKSPKVGVSGYTARDDVRESRRGKV